MSVDYADIKQDIMVQGIEYWAGKVFAEVIGRTLIEFIMTDAPDYTQTLQFTVARSQNHGDGVILSASVIETRLGE